MNKNQCNLLLYSAKAKSLKKSSPKNLKKEKLVKLNYSRPGFFKFFSSGKQYYLYEFFEILEHCAKLICFSGAYTTKNCKAFSSDYNNLDFEAVDEDVVVEASSAIISC